MNTEEKSFLSNLLIWVFIGIPVAVIMLFSCLIALMFIGLFLLTPLLLVGLLIEMIF